MFKILFLAYMFFGAFFGIATAHAKNCTYNLDLENTVLEGTGYKFTEKLGVAAKFPGFKLSHPEKKQPQGPNLREAVVGQTMVVDLMTIDSGNVLRDQNLRESLFANIKGDSVASITIKKMTDSKIETEFKLNEKTKPVVFDYTVKGDVLSAKGKIDALDFGMSDSMNALKKMCGALHTGSDGKSVTWSEFGLSLTAKFTEKCN